MLKLIIFLIGGKENMAIVYATLITKGKKKFHEVPLTVKEEVRQILIDLDLEYLIDG